MTESRRFATDYVSLWNEREPALRRSAIAILWDADAVHFVGTRSVRGLDEINARVTESHEKNVRDGGYVFRASDDAQALHDSITFHWEMVPAGGGDVAARGLEFVIVGANRRIVADYQFIVAVR